MNRIVYNNKKFDPTTSGYCFSSLPCCCCLVTTHCLYFLSIQFLL